MQIEFEIDGMRLTRTSDAYVTEGSKNFVQLLFTFSDDWNNIDKWALFARDNKTYEVAIVDGKCIVPYECARTSGQFQLTVVGKANEGDVIATTSDKAVRVSSNEFEENPTGSETRLTNTFLVDTLAKVKEYADKAKEYSESVNVFIPSVDADGVMTWTNKAGLANPAPVNVKGERGPQGLPGAKGDKGDKGDAFKYTDFTASQLAALKGPKGDEGLQGATGATGPQGERGPQGLQGPAGNAATITIGNVTTSAPGTSASVTNRGTSSAVVLDFVLPRGEDGADGGVTVDEELSSTSTNPVQNNVIYNALLNKVGTDIFSGFALMGAASTIAWRQGSQPVGSINASSYTGNAASATKATQDGAGNIITETYAKKADVSGVVKSVNGTKPDRNGNVSITVSGGSNVTVDTTLSATSTNPIANKTVYNALDNKLDKTAAVYEATKATQDGYGNVITSTYARKVDLASYVKTVNNTAPDASGNVNIAVSGSGGVSTSESNTWSAQQNFHDLMLNREKYTTYVVNGTSDTPVTSTMVYAVTGAFTLNLATLAGALSASQSSVFTAYFAANADYSLTISNAGKLKYVGSASDVAITSAGMLLNILMTKDASGNLTSIVQASKLS